MFLHPKKETGRKTEKNDNNMIKKIQKKKRYKVNIKKSYYYHIHLLSLLFHFYLIFFITHIIK